MEADGDSVALFNKDGRITRSAAFGWKNSISESHALIHGNAGIEALRFADDTVEVPKCFEARRSYLGGIDGEDLLVEFQPRFGVAGKAEKCVRDGNSYGVVGRKKDIQ